MVYSLRPQRVGVQFVCLVTEVRFGPIGVRTLHTFRDSPCTLGFAIVKRARKYSDVISFFAQSVPTHPPSLVPPLCPLSLPLFFHLSPSLSSLPGGCLTGERGQGEQRDIRIAGRHCVVDGLKLRPVGGVVQNAVSPCAQSILRHLWSSKVSILHH
jgi:hypothetical protein